MNYLELRISVARLLFIWRSIYRLILIVVWVSVTLTVITSTNLLDSNQTASHTEDQSFKDYDAKSNPMQNEYCPYESLCLLELTKYLIFWELCVLISTFVHDRKVINFRNVVFVNVPCIIDDYA